MRRSLAVLLSGGLLLLGSFAVTSGVSAAVTIAPTTTCGNSLGNGGGQGLICDITVVNTLSGSGGSSVVTVRECVGAAGPPATQATCTTRTTALSQLVTSIEQCNDSINGGGGTLRCSLQVIFEGASGGSSAVTLNQCVGSGGGITTGCNPFPATTTGATITQCNGSANGGTLVGMNCTAAGTVATAPALTINQCNGSANGGGALLTCTANVSSNAAPASPSPSASASPSVSPSPSASASPSASPSPSVSPSPSATASPTATVAPRPTTRPTIPPTSTSTLIGAEPTGNGLPVLVGLVFLAALSLMAASRRYRTVHHPR